MKCNDKINRGKLTNFIETSISNAFTESKGASATLPMGDSFCKFKQAQIFGTKPSLKIRENGHFKN